MKKLFLFLTAALFATSLWADQTWDFTVMSDADKTAYNAATNDWKWDSSNKRYDNKFTPNNGTWTDVISTTITQIKDMKFMRSGSNMGTGAIRIFPNTSGNTDGAMKYNNSNVAFSIPVTEGDTLTITFSNTNSSAKGYILTNAKRISDNATTITSAQNANTTNVLIATATGRAEFKCNDSKVILCKLVLKNPITCDPIGVASTGEASSITHESASLPFYMDKTTGVDSLTIKVYDNSNDNIVATYSRITPATSGSQTVTGLSESTTYYYTITTLSKGGDFCEGVTTAKSSTFETTSAPVNNPTITAAVNEAEWGSVSPAYITVTSGNEVSIDDNELTCGGQTLTASPANATPEYTFEFANWSNVSDGDKITANITVRANFTRKANIYAVNYSAPTNGTYTITVGEGEAVSADTTAAYGQTVSLTATPATGYKLVSWTVAKAVGTVTVENNQFTMPAEAVTISATFEEMEVCYTFTPKVVGANDTLATGDVVATSNGGIMTAQNNYIIYTSNGLLFANSGNAKVNLTLRNKMQVGTVITAVLWQNDTKAGRTLKLNTASGTNKATWDATPSTSAGEEKIFTYTVTAGDGLADANALQLQRGGNVYLRSLTIADCGDEVMYDITIATGLANGSVGANVAKAALGDSITLSNTPASGYKLDAYDVYKTEDADTKVTVTAGKFAMPPYAVTVSGSFSQGTALDNVEESASAIKHIENGQLIIEKNGVRYNAMGQIIR